MPWTGSTSICGRLRAARGEVRVDLGAVDDQRVLERRPWRKAPRSALVLASASVGALPDDELAGLRLGRQRVAQRERAHLLRQVVRVAAHDRTHRAAAAAELRHARRAVTGAAGALLLVHLLAGAMDVGAPERLVVAGAGAWRAASAPCARSGPRAARGRRSSSLEFERARGRSVDRRDVEFHGRQSPLSPRRPPLRPRRQ